MKEKILKMLKSKKIWIFIYNSMNLIINKYLENFNLTNILQKQ